MLVTDFHRKVLVFRHPVVSGSNSCFLPFRSKLCLTSNLVPLSSVIILSLIRGLHSNNPLVFYEEAKSEGRKSFEYVKTILYSTCLDTLTAGELHLSSKNAAHATLSIAEYKVLMLRHDR